MSISKLSRLLALGSLCAAGAAHADFQGTIGPAGIIDSPSSTAFANPTVTAGTVSGKYNFLDQWSFSLSTGASVASIVAAISFTDPFGPLGPILLQGIQNLQVNLMAVGSSVPLVSWLTVTTPVSGLESDVALIPSAPLSGGDYVLEVRGTLAAPGSYSGSLIASPSVVPLPDSLALMLSGCVAFGAVALRKGLPARG